MSDASDDGAVVVAALVGAYDALRANHPDLPRVVFVIGHGRARRRGGALLGHYLENSWRRKGARTRLTPEIFIAGEHLRAGGAAVFETILHEAAHALAAAREIAETSRQNRYHNGRFLQLAEELGLRHATGVSDPRLGFSEMRLRPETRATYADAISRLGQALVANRLPAAHTDDTRNRNYVKAVCGCRPARIVRMSPGVVAEGGVLCQRCEREFRAAA
jgi:hypothetical protein